MSNTIQTLTINQLRRAITIKEHIEELETELASLASDGSRGTAKASSPRKRRRMSVAGRARIAAAAKARWAKMRGPVVVEKPRKRKKFSAAVRAKMSAAIKDRWAKAKAAGKTAL